MLRLLLSCVNGAICINVYSIGFGLGAYHYALKMFVYQRVRARNFARAWSFVQASQALPLVCGIPLAGKIRLHKAINIDEKSIGMFSKYLKKENCYY